MQIESMEQLMTLARALAPAPAPEEAGSPSFVGKICLVRTYASGVHCGTVVYHQGQEVVLRDARRLWEWHAVGGISLSEVARNGIHHKGSRVCLTVPEILISDFLELIPVSPDAGRLIMSAPVHMPE